MTVKELRDLLQKYSDEDVVEIDGGNEEYGSSMFDYAELSVNGETLLKL